MVGVMQDTERMLAELERGRPAYARRGRTHLGDLELRMHEAAVWCERNLDPGSIGSCLRPRRIAPQCLPRNRWDPVEDVTIMRRQELRESVTDVRRPGAGKLLVYFPDANLSDGAAELESQEFFDVYNAPPWGTWVAYLDDGGQDVSYSSYLLAWVPEGLIAIANAAIEVNPEQCVTWLANTTVRVRPVIKSLGVHP
jgi:hypothetical protein